MQSVNYRNLEQIREQDRGRQSTQLWAVALSAAAISALIVAGVVTLGHGRAPRTAPRDPLAEIAAKQRASRPASAGQAQDAISFPAILSDADKPTAPMAAVANAKGELLPLASPAPQASAPISVVPGLGMTLPAGDLLASTAVTRDPKDDLTRLAGQAAKAPATGEMAAEGHDGEYQIQVASFRSSEDADGFVTDLRHRSHHAYRQAAYVPDRGLWHRVRIGPFKSKYEATQYRNQLERSERILGFVVEPERDKSAKVESESEISSRTSKKAEPAGNEGT
jgi:DedD protein